MKFFIWIKQDFSKCSKGVGAIRPLFGPKITANLKVIIHILKLLKTCLRYKVLRKTKQIWHRTSYHGNKSWLNLHILLNFVIFLVFSSNFKYILDWKSMCAPKKQLYIWWDNANSYNKAFVKLFCCFSAAQDVSSTEIKIENCINSVFFIVFVKTVHIMT